MDRKVSFTNSAICGISAETAKAPSVEGAQVAAAPKPKAARGTLNYFLSVALDVTRKDQSEVSPLLPSLAVVFTVGGPLVYQPSNH
jgi:hypothetical protein